MTSFLWSVRRRIAPILRKIQKYPIFPDKSTLELSEEKFVGEIDASPAAVRQAFEDDSDWTPCWLASIQFETSANSETKSWEVASFARRPQGLSGEWQTHARLMSRAAGERTALYAHYERNPWTHPKKHYHAEGWDAAAGVGVIRSWIRRQSDFELIE
jgi:hypothetical protein